MNHIVKTRARAAGFRLSGKYRTTEEGPAELVQISTHSVRRGSVTAAFTAGTDAVVLARHAGFADESLELRRYHGDRENPDDEIPGTALL